MKSGNFPTLAELIRAISALRPDQIRSDEPGSARCQFSLGFNPHDEENVQRLTGERYQ